MYSHKEQHLPLCQLWPVTSGRWPNINQSHRHWAGLTKKSKYVNLYGEEESSRGEEEGGLGWKNGDKWVVWQKSLVKKRPELSRFSSLWWWRPWRKLNSAFHNSSTVPAGGQYVLTLKPCWFTFCCPSSLCSLQLLTCWSSSLSPTSSRHSLIYENNEE